MASIEPPVPGDVLDDFLLLDRLGRGSFADVWLARQQSLQRFVALKISDDEGHEPATLAQLDHPNIVRVFDQRRVAEHGLRLLYMEYVPGGTLEQVVARVRDTPPERRDGRLLLACVDAALTQRSEPAPEDSLARREIVALSWPRTVARLGATLAEALHHAHEAGVLHRDVKPANVLLASNAEAKLADFNTARAPVATDPASDEVVGGSLAYMPAEQVRAMSPFHDEDADAVDGRGDLYALGVLLVELLTGELPWPERNGPEGGDWRAYIDALLEDRRRAATALALPADTPPALASALRACLAEHPADRPADGHTLASRLRLALHPDVERLVEEADRGWHGVVRRRPLLSVLTATAIPSIVLSALNITYNLHTVIERDPTWGSFTTQVGVVNGIAYTFGLGLLAWLARPFARAVREERAGRPVIARDVDRALALPRNAATVALPLWLLGGAAFPIWRTIEGGVVPPAAWAHFVTSNGLFGLLAAATAFFLVAKLVTSAALPRIVSPPRATAWPARSARRLEREAHATFGVCVAVPFVSVVVNTFMPEGSSGAYLALGILGVLAFGVAWPAFDRLRRTLAALRRAVAAPAEDGS